MLIDPKYKVYDSKEDIIDYVTRGFLPPRQAYFDALIEKVRTPDQDVIENDERQGKEVLISERIINCGGAKTTADVLERVYENRKRNFIKGSIGLGIIGTLLTIIGIKTSRKNKNKIRELEETNDYLQMLLFAKDADEDDAE